MTSEEYEELVGKPPEHDDLERASCLYTGRPGHYFCGICPICKKPKAACFMDCGWKREDTEEAHQEDHCIGL